MIIKSKKFSANFVLNFLLDSIILIKIITKKDIHKNRNFYASCAVLGEDVVYTI